MPRVNYLRVAGCEHVAAKGLERNEERLPDRPPKMLLALMSPLEVHRAVE